MNTQEASRADAQPGNEQTEKFMAVLAEEMDRRGTLPLEELERAAIAAGAQTPVLAMAFRLRAERRLVGRK